MRVITNEPKERISPVMPGPVEIPKDYEESAMIPTVTTYKKTQIGDISVEEKSVEEKKEKVELTEEYGVRLDGQYICSFTTNKTGLDKLYDYLKDTGMVMFVDDVGNLLYLNQPKRLTISLKPKKDPLMKKHQRIPPKQIKKWWKWWKK